jgi:hypothetical protein
LQPPHLKTNSGAGLEGCPYAKNNTQTTARNTAQANRFSFTMLFLLLYPGSLDTAVNRWAAFVLAMPSY